MSPTICKECGKEVPHGAKKCPRCGVRVTTKAVKILIGLLVVGSIGAIYDGISKPKNPPTVNSGISGGQSLQVWKASHERDKHKLCASMVGKIDADVTPKELCSCISEASTGQALNVSIAETAAACAILITRS